MTTANLYPHLFSPLQIGNMHVKNRLMMSAMSINFGVDEHCYVTDQLVQYFVERAKGGVGMMLVGGGSVHPGGQELPDLPVMYEEGCIPSLMDMVSKVKDSASDVKFGVQLMHGGRQSYLPEKVAPSPIPAPAVVKGEVRALEIDDIKELVSCFGDAARRCRDAGFDFVEIHAAHGYLINQFMAPNSNIRDDQYGGAFENRIRFLLEVIEDIQLKAGLAFPVGIRINGRDYIENGWELDDALKLAPILEDAGVAYLHVSGGVYGSTELTIPSMYTEHGCFVHLAEAVKKVVSIPVVTVGRIKTPVLAEKVIGECKADVVSMGRALLADPMLPLKAMEGRESEIRPCVGCCLGCIHAVLAKEPGSCVVNPDVGREYKLRDDEGQKNRYDEKQSCQHTFAKRRILIAGAGPSGMACARLFALRGHDVKIVEKLTISGGILSLASRAPGRGEIGDILNFFSKELERLNVKIQYDTSLNEDIVSGFMPDHVIVATGSMPDMPMIKGLFQSSMDVVTNVDVLDGDEILDNTEEVIVLGGGMSGLITADYIAEKIRPRGGNVYVLNRKKRFAEEMSANDRYYLRESLKKKQVQLFKNVSIERFTDKGVKFRIKGNSELMTIEPCNMVVISEKQISIREFARIESTSSAKFHYIGDASSPRHLMFCISEAEEIARSI
ncbi:2,4-dienoyl-CoA reductase (NADPH) [Desulfamplus magnetovallimortis]|uniref:2,4-dienoyl-CoA reductase (NADPH) n=1 Tax=Desulfamplus magnetovallimortis TaxID=1246637 RepID=A0A1W1HIK7_9BACT|nr:FAD-dependent oxidoreductase [Desulfamplus magnetovallimortis]SLM32276.1 2,4-dienoyl-CoA reductase (NADPH) [Desulfamplus magnetovallimortis]